MTGDYYGLPYSTLPALDQISPMSSTFATLPLSDNNLANDDDDPGALSDPGVADARAQAEHVDLLKRREIRDRRLERSIRERSVRETKMCQSLGVGAIVR